MDSTAATSMDGALRVVRRSGAAVAVGFGVYVVIGVLWTVLDLVGLVIGTALAAAVVVFGIWKGGTWRWWAIAGAVLATPYLWYLWLLRDISVHGLLPD